jgi:NAD(P)-dependent dehydrogenase (short-subunit alcohol dehydrogenase family)
LNTSRAALVTGGSRGIGRAIVERLRARGIDVHAPTRDQLDLADPDSVRRWCGGAPNLTIDILINNAGINELRGITHLDDEAWAAMEQVNLRAPLALMRAYLPGMQTRGWGRVVNIASIWAHAARERRGGYAATKAAIIAATQVAALECAPHGVLVNAISPGFTATELTRKNNSPTELEAICAKIPLGRLAEPTEIANAVAWLASADNSYITGQAILVDGGYTLP